MLKVCVSILHVNVDQKVLGFFLKRTNSMYVFFFPSWAIHAKEHKNGFILVHILRKNYIRVETLLLSECCVPCVHRNNPAINTVVLEGFSLINTQT